ncbi:MAG TPA: hypothetical protein EYH23_01050 [Euryarchaeota archaeon]|nr:hypothetical protein [Euryarchaeota archaeon]
METMDFVLKNREVVQDIENAENLVKKLLGFNDNADLDDKKTRKEIANRLEKISKIIENENQKLAEELKNMAEKLRKGEAIDDFDNFISKKSANIAEYIKKAAKTANQLKARAAICGTFGMGLGAVTGSGVAMGKMLSVDTLTVKIAPKNTVSIYVSDGRTPLEIFPITYSEPRKMIVAEYP